MAEQPSVSERRGDLATSAARDEGRPLLSRYAREAGQRREERAEPLRDAPESSRQTAPHVRFEPQASVHVMRGEIVPVPVPEPARRPVDDDANVRLPFWKRLALRRSAVSSAPATQGPSLAPILERLSELEEQLAAARRASEERLDRFEENITRLWELEEQIGLSEVSERLALLEATQVELADAIHSVSRNLSILAIVLAAGVAVAALTAGLLL